MRSQSALRERARSHRRSVVTLRQACRLRLGNSRRMSSSAIEALFEEHRALSAASRVCRAGQRSAGIYEEAERDYLAFWASWARKLEWMKPFTKTLEWNEPFARWFGDGELNVSVNCLDRHVRAGRGAQDRLLLSKASPATAGRSPIASCSTTSAASPTACASSAFIKGDRVAIYMPMIPELARGDARLRAHRRGAFGDLRRLLARSRSSIASTTRSASRSLPPITAGGAATKVPLKRQLRHRHGAYALDQALHRRAAASATTSSCARAAIIGGSEIVAGRAAAVRTRADERRRPALSSLHQRHDGQAERHQTYHRRLFNAGG